MTYQDLFRQTADAMELVDKHGVENCFIEIYDTKTKEWWPVRKPQFNVVSHFRAKLISNEEKTLHENTIVRLTVGGYRRHTFKNCSIVMSSLCVSTFDACVFENCKILTFGFSTQKFVDCDFIDIVCDGSVAKNSTKCFFKNYTSIGTSHVDLSVCRNINDIKELLNGNDIREVIAQQVGGYIEEFLERYR